MNENTEGNRLALCRTEGLKPEKLHVINENISQYSRQVFRPSLAFSKPRILRFAMIKRKSASPGDHSRIERESRDVKRDMSTSKKLFLETMRTLRKQFPVNWLTSASLVFKIQCVRGRRNQYMKEAAVSVDGLSSLDATYFMILWTGARMKEFKSIFRHFGFSLQVTWNQKKTCASNLMMPTANCVPICYLLRPTLFLLIKPRTKSLWYPRYIKLYLR